MEPTIVGFMGGCQNYDPFLDPYYNTAPNIQDTQKGTIILTTTHMPVLNISIAKLVASSPKLAYDLAFLSFLCLTADRL